VTDSATIIPGQILTGSLFNEPMRVETVEGNGALQTFPPEKDVATVGRAAAPRPAGENKGQPMLVDVQPVRLRTRVRFPPPPYLAGG
jgi:hypothetical protein